MVATARTRLLVLAVLLALTGGALLAIGPDTVGRWLRDGAATRWGVAAFIVAYALAVVALLPGTIGSVSAGLLYGFPLAVPVALAGATLGAIGAFLIGRGLGRDGVRALVGDRASGADAWIEGNDFASILVLRLMPIVPFNGLNYAAGLAPVRLGRYSLATVLGMAPGTALVTLAASQADEPTGAAFLAAMTGLTLATGVAIVAANRWRAARA